MEENPEWDAPLVPLEFMGMLIEKGEQTLVDWLKSQKAPEAVTDVVRELLWLMKYEAQARLTGSVDVADNMEVMDSIAELATAITACGGQWTNQAPEAPDEQSNR